MIFPGARTAEQQLIAESVGAFCADLRRRTEGRPPVLTHSPDLWLGLADLGILAHGGPDEQGTAMDLVVAAEALGTGGLVAPVAEAFAAARLLPSPLRHRLNRGTLVVALDAGHGRPFRWAGIAELVITFDAGGDAWLAQPQATEDDPDLAGAIPWGTAELERIEHLGPGLAACAVALAAFAALLCGLADQMVRDTAAYAAERRQFGRPIGTFQAVGHPLAESHARVLAARDLAQSVAQRLDLEAATEDAGAEIHALGEMAVRAACRAALRATYACQQALGGMGYVEEGPMGVLPMVVRALCTGDVAHVPRAVEVAA